MSRSLNRFQLLEAFQPSQHTTNRLRKFKRACLWTSDTCYLLEKIVFTWPRKSDIVSTSKYDEELWLSIEEEDTFFSHTNRLSPCQFPDSFTVRIVYCNICLMKSHERKRKRKWSVLNEMFSRRAFSCQGFQLWLSQRDTRCDKIVSYHYYMRHRTSFCHLPFVSRAFDVFSYCDRTYIQLAIDLGILIDSTQFGIGEVTVY